MSKSIRLAIDANEANIKNRVGSNVYAFEIINELWRLTKDARKFQCTVLLSSPPAADLPKKRNNWQYKVIGPKRLWTQWALPLHLFWNQKEYDLLYTPGHYAPRFSPIPYVSSVMDLAFLTFPEQFHKNDLFQLKSWTEYSAKHAKKIITISQFSKQEIQKHYHREANDIVVAPPGISLPDGSPLRAKAFFRKNGINPNNYILYLGTIQPRKNLINLIEAFEIFSRFHAAHQLKKKTSSKSELEPPQLVLAGKIGWLAKGIEERIAASPLKSQIILTGFVSNDLKRPLYENARATALVGLLEGFGIPALESLSVGTMPVVANTSSLPEVVGDVGLTVDPENPQAIADALKEAWNEPASKKSSITKKAAKQVAKFSWSKSAKTILNALVQATQHD